MSQAVEARSLTRLNVLASNPPKYPINPTEQKQEPLVLYISRVPGSRDIIFSPLKPQLKNVTGEDVANSLYYIHLNTPADAELQAGQESHTPRQSLETSPINSTSSPVARPPIARKPLPPSARTANPASTPAPAVLSRDRQPESPTGSQGNLETTAPVNEAHAAAGTNQDSENLAGNQAEVAPPVKDIAPQYQSPTSKQQQPSPIARKPLGPRPIDTLANSQPKPNHPSNADVYSSSTAPPVRPLTERPENIAAAVEPTMRSPRSPSPSKRSRNLVPFTLTIIRRDPSTGNQWNVGQVSSYQSLSPPTPLPDPDAPPSYSELAGLAPTATAAAAAPGGVAPTIHIRLETSGYAKFRGNFPTRENVDPSRRQRAASTTSSTAGRSTDSLSLLRGSAPATGEEFFTRQLVMNYQKTWTSNIKEAWRNRKRSHSTSPIQHEEQVASPLSPLQPPPRPPFHTRPGSSGSVGSVTDVSGSSPTRPSLGGLPPAFRASIDHQPPPPQLLITAPGPGLKPRGYAFASPWDGLCEFRTSASGRGVKCVHSLLPGCGGGGGDAAVLPTTVSELRFNLPNADLFRDKGQELQSRLDRLKLDGGGGGRGHARGLSGGRGHHARRPSGGASPDECEYDPAADDHDDGLDLSLGRERAGGGNRGKRAKLGKLIIYDEGLKMLDLVVAANVGVWWGAWEKSF